MAARWQHGSARLWWQPDGSMDLPVELIWDCWGKKYQVPFYFFTFLPNPFNCHYHTDQIYAETFEEVCHKYEETTLIYSKSLFMGMPFYVVLVEYNILYISVDYQYRCT